MHPFSFPPFRLARPLGLAAVVIALAFTLADDVLRPLESHTVDWRQSLRRPSPAALAPVMVGIGDSAFRLAESAPAAVAADPVLAQMSRSWPWDRQVFAAVLRKLRAAGARAVVFDLVFDAPNPGDPDFAAALAEPGTPVVLAAVFEEQHSIEGEGLVTFVEPRPEFLGPRHVHTGFSNVQPDPDGVVRQTHLVTTAARVLDGWSTTPDTDPTVLSLAGATAAALGAGPDTPHGIIDFGTPSDLFPLVPIENLFLPDRWEGTLLARGRLFRDRVVLVGPWSEIRFKDYHATPLGRIAGVELQAYLVANLLGDGLLRTPPAGTAALAVIALTALVALGSARARGASRQLLVVGGIAAVWLTVVLLAFAFSGWVLPLVAPLGAGLATGTFALTVSFVGEQRERRRMRGLLASYVSEQVARVIVRQPEAFDAACRGERRAVTALFADIRGYTQLAEHADPATFIDQLNEYLHRVVDCVLAADGTLQKFIGDAVLAVWGDTHTTGEAGDAVRAVSAALAIEAAVSRLNEDWANRADRPPLRIGVGLHQGPAMVGNIGHPRRMEFAVIGDTINLASRLEGANRVFETTILVGETVQRLTAEAFYFAPVARIVAKGHSQPVAVFTPVAPRNLPAPGWLEPYGAAFAALDRGRFALAADAFAALPAADARFSGLFAHQADFARQLAASPPAHWDGIRRLDQK